ncbi:MAG: hypothetical protein V3R83_12365 [Gammaproteobacteria bacterium]
MGATNNPNFKKGCPKNPKSGRRKGTPNKKTVAVQDALQQAFDELGGIEALVEFARNEPTEFYRLWVKMLPKNVHADITSNGEIIAPAITSTQALKMIKDFQAQDQSAGTII